MNIKIDWSKITDNVAVNCRTEEEAEMFVGAVLEKFPNNLMRWENKSFWYESKEETCYSLEDERLWRSDNWKLVEMERYLDALWRHLIAFTECYASKDTESGIHHYKHAECNMAFISDMMAKRLEQNGGKV